MKTISITLAIVFKAKEVPKQHIKNTFGLAINYRVLLIRRVMCEQFIQ